MPGSTLTNLFDVSRGKCRANEGNFPYETERTPSREGGTGKGKRFVE